MLIKPKPSTATIFPSARQHHHLLLPLPSFAASSLTTQGKALRKPAMALSSNNSSRHLLLFLLSTLLILSLQTLPVSSFEYRVGGRGGWVVPPANETDVYNHWASEKRFQVGDAIRFKYKKDSVMAVTKEGYETCNSTEPSFFSNNGDTVFRFEHSGAFYFISGMAGHCERGQKMIVRVLAKEEDERSSSASSYSAVPSAAIFTVLCAQLAFSCVARYYLF